MFRFLFLLGIFIFLFSFGIENNLYSQAGMKLPELKQRLEPYFAPELISDLEKKLPQGTNYSIWGWDVGDFSGDGFNDVAFSVKYSGEKRKIAHVFLFIDSDGYLTQIAQLPFEYVELPLEIGVVIKQNACFITKKYKQFSWEIVGYRFDNGIITLLDKFNTEKVGKYTHETYKNYQSLLTSERYITINNEIKLNANYITVPSYNRGVTIYKGISNEALSMNVEYVNKGAYYWEGSSDASFSVRSSFDSDYLYFIVKIRDDKFVNKSCETCPSDYLELWFDSNLPASGSSRFVKQSGEKIVFREKEESGIFCFRLYPGDFLEKKAFVKEVSSTDDLEDYQKQALNKIKVTSTLSDSGFQMKFRIPFLVFGFENAPVQESKFTEYGCSIVYHDIDNEYRPEEETQISTSSFDFSNPLSYGSLILIPQNKWYGEAENIYSKEILRILFELGF